MGSRTSKAGLLQSMSERGFDPRNFFTNMCTLGFFNYMARKSRETCKPTGKNRSLIQSEMWASQAVCGELEPRKLFNVTVQKHPALY